MARRKTDIPEYLCGDCVHLVPSQEYLSVRGKRPILGRCPFSKYMRLMSDTACDQYKTRTY